MSFCAECGSKLDATSRFCGHCGAGVGGEVPADAPPPVTGPAQSPPVPSAPPVAPHAASAGTNRTLMWLGATAAVAAGVVGIVMVVAGGDDDPAASPAAPTSVSVAPATTDADAAAATTSASPESTVAPTTTTAPTTTVAPATTAPPTTVPPTTAAPTTAAPATTVPPVVAPGWSPAAYPMQAYPSVWEANWIGAASPTIVDPAAPLPDGRYATTFVEQTPGSLVVDIHRFEACSVLGEPFCFPGPWAPEELGVTEAIGRASLPLDTSLRAVVLGFECEEIVAETNGPELDALYGALYVDYEAAFGPGLAGGVDTSAIVEQVRATPVGGFGPPTPTCDDGFSLQWRFGDAPPVLVQWPFDWETDGWAEPASLLVPTMIEVEGPITTVYLYGGYYS